MQKFWLAVAFFSVVACSEGSRNAGSVPETDQNSGQDTGGETEGDESEPDPGNSDAGGTPDVADIGSYTLVNAYPNLSFDRAVFATGVPGEDRLVVVGQRGTITVFTDDDNVVDSKTVLDISDTIEFGGEQGLLGLAFDPAFSENRFVYLHYTMNPPRRSVISRMTWQAAADTIDPATELVILEVEQPFRNHNAGMLAFGADNYLYIGMGDGGSGGDPDNHGQNGATMLGSMLRVDVANATAESTYSIPNDNPYLNSSGILDEIYALGLRNPFRFSFDRANNDLWLGDVGQGAWEEINIVEAGGNYGWRVYEGNAIYNDSDNTLEASAFKEPVIAYNRSDGYSVIGGYVYRGQLLSRLEGYYVYADYGSGTVWALRRNGTAVSNQVIATAANPTSFGETNSAELLVVTQSSGLFRLIETDR